jgi:hypothetical protein
MVCRNRYVQNRVAVRMKQRGEPIILRSVSMLNGPEPFRNPPDLSDDITVTAGSITNGQAFIGLAGSTITGRLVPGDQILLADVLATTLTVLAMPDWVATDVDGIPEVDANGDPVVGEPLIYYSDTLAAENGFPVIAVEGVADPTTLLDAAVDDIVFAADQTCYGIQMSRQQMVEMGWVEMDSIGVQLAAQGLGDLQPKVNDQLIFGATNDIRSIMSINRRAIGGVAFTLQIQAR